MKNKKKWFLSGILSSTFLTLFVLLLPSLQENNLISVPYKVNPFRHTLGWRQIPAILNDQGYNPSEHFLFSDKYQMTSLLSFYGPKKQRAYFLNIQKSRNNQFCFWPSMADEQVGKTGFFLFAENLDKVQSIKKMTSRYKKLLQPYFSYVEVIDKPTPIFSCQGKPVKVAVLLRCFGYNGKKTAYSSLY